MWWIAIGLGRVSPAGDSLVHSRAAGAPGLAMGGGRRHEYYRHAHPRRPRCNGLARKHAAAEQISTAAEPSPPDNALSATVVDRDRRLRALRSSPS